MKLSPPKYKYIQSIDLFISFITVFLKVKQALIESPEAFQIEPMQLRIF